LEVFKNQITSLTKNTHYIGGSELELREMPKWKTIPGSQIRQEGEENQFFLSNLHPSTMEKEVDDHFSKYGRLLSVIIVRDEGSLDCQGYAVIHFAEGNNLEETLENSTHVIRGRTIAAKSFFVIPADTEPIILAEVNQNTFDEKLPGLEKENFILQETVEILKVPVSALPNPKLMESMGNACPFRTRKNKKASKPILTSSNNVKGWV